MFPGPTTQPEPSRGYCSFARSVSHHGEQQHQYGTPPRPVMEPPRPLEPRPTHQLHASLSEASGSHRRSEIYPATSNATLDYRTHTQNLPGLRDILTSGSPVVTQSPYSAWSQTSAAPTSYHSSEGYYSSSQSGLHPPLALQPSLDPNTQYASQSCRRIELPILETHPVGRNPPQSLPVSPYVGYPEHGRDYIESRYERPRQASTSSYLPNGVPSPYTPVSTEEGQYRLSAQGYDITTNLQTSPQAPLPQGPLAGAENQKKYLGVKEFPGEGTYHVYEGGHRIPTQVDGESVNPAWGLTKANKPRKRLALACLDCREKKIKCEPGVGSCLQCEKAKRPCRRAPGQQTQSDVTPSTAYSPAAESPAQTKQSERVSDPTPHGTRGVEAECMMKRGREDPSPPGVPAKKHRSASPMLVSRDEIPPHAGPSSQTPYETVLGPPENSRKVLAWGEDPYVVNPEITLRLLDLYFAHINNGTYCMFPRRAFLRWVQNCRVKCQNELMLLYAVLAMASVFADDSLSSFGKRCATIATDAVASKHGRFSLLMAQTRILLSLYNFAKGSEGAAWDFCGSALRALSALRFGKEDGCLDFSDVPEDARRELSLTKVQLAECRRRTFWAGFLMDRYNGFCGSTLCFIQPADVYLRLPCHDTMYDNSQPSNAPFYNNGVVDPTLAILTPSSPVAPVAWLCLISALWGDVMTFIYRAIHRAPAGYRDAYEAFHAEMQTAFQGWYSRLPPDLHYSDANLDRSIQYGYAGTFISMHVLYHFSLMKLNRNVRHALIPEQLPRNIRAAHYHAHELLRIMCGIAAARRDIVQPIEGQPARWSFSTPFSGYATLSAIDVVSGGSPEARLGQTLESIRGGMVCLRELAQYWDSARAQHTAGEKRALQIENVIQRPNKARNGAWLGRKWGVEGQLEKDFDPEDDCIYGVEYKIYFAALEDDTGNGSAPAGGLRIA